MPIPPLKKEKEKKNLKIFCPFLQKFYEMASGAGTAVFNELQL